MPATSRILIVDDQPIVRKGFAVLLSAQAGLNICGEANGLSQAMKAFRQLRPQLVTVEMALQNGSGLELTKELVVLDSRIKVLVCSVHDERLFAERALRAGAKGYINKCAEPQALVVAVRKILDGGIYLSERMTNQMLDRTFGRDGQHREQSLVESFSDRELEVFEQIGRGQTTHQIAEKLYLSPKTIETYRDNLKLKLNLQNATQLRQCAMKWVLENF